MEATAVQEEEINVARPSGSIIQIKAISIDLMFPNKTCANFQHNFSIRGYAAEMKAKNPKACNPFSSDGFNDFEEQLPPSYTYQNLDVQSETPQDSVPLSKDVEKVPDSLNEAGSDVVIEIVEAAVNTDTDVRDAEEIADVGDIPVTGNETVSHEGINGDTDNVPVLSEFQKAESSGLLPEEKMNSANDEQINAETGNPVQNIDDVSVAEPEDSVLEAENMNNVLYDSDWSEEDVPSSNSSRRKVRKVRLLSDLLSEKGSIIKTDPVREYSSATSSKSLEPTEAETSRSHDRNLRDDVDTDSSGPHTKENFNQEEETSSVRGKLAAKSDAEPTVKRSVIPSSGSGLRIGNKADRLKRKIEKNQSLIKKKRKASQVFDAFPSNKPSKELPKSVNIRNDDFKRCHMSVSRSFGSSSAAGEPTNSSHDYQSARETDKYRNDVSQTPLQIPNLTFNDWSSRKGPFTLDRYQQKVGSSRNPDSVETEIHLKKKKKKKKKKNNFRFGEGGIPPTSGEVLLKNKQVLDLNERATHNSSYEFTKGSFPMPKERDFFHHCEQEKLYENQGPSKLVSEQRKHRDGKAVVQGSSDDIPMEIVELMAKNQYERTLGNTGSHLGSFRTFNTMRTFPELQDTRNMERPAAIGYSGLTSFPSPNVRSGMNLPTGSVHYSQMGRNHYNMGQVERSLSIYDAFPQNQRPYSATASVRTGPQHGDVVGPSMLSRFGIGSVQNFSVSTPESSHKGKTISDIKADELKKTQEARSFMPEQVGFEFNHKLKGPLDPYANENIPALQLLSLMDERSPGTSFNAGTSRIFDHGQTPGFLNGFLHHNHARENYGLGIGAHNAEECSGQRPFTFSGSLSLESQMQDRSREKVNIFGSASDVSNSGGQTSYRGKDKQKTVAVYSESDDSHMETESGQENITRLRTLPPHVICSLNRNPADFSVPEAGNEFTIAGKDIKFRKKRKHPSSRPLKSCVHNDGTKQQRKEKTKARKEKGIIIINNEE